MSRPKGSSKTPALTHHKASGRAVVRIDGQDHYCGRWGTVAARREYDRLIGEWLVRGRTTPRDAGQASGGITVKEVLAAFWIHASDYYKGAGEAKASGELDKFRNAMKPLKRLYGETPAASFGPIALKAVRAEMLTLERRGVRWSRW